MQRIPLLFNPSGKFIRLGLALAGLALCCFSAWSVANAGLSRLFSTYGSRVGNLASVDEALRLSPSDPTAHHARALVLKNMGRNDEALQEFESAVRLRPDDYYLWLELGHAREELEDVAGATIAFREAVRLAPEYAQPRWQLGNFILRTGDTDSAFVELRQAVASDATLLPALIDLAWGAYEADTTAVLKAVQPQTDSAKLSLATYYAAHQEAGAAIDLFRSVASEAHTEERLALVTALLAAGNLQEAHEVWSVGNKSPDSGAILFDGGFEREINVDEAGFGWKTFRGAQTINIALDAHSPRAGARSLRLEYAGNFGVATPVISQLVLVKPQTRYRLSFATRSQDLVSAGLPVVTVKNADSETEILSQSDPLVRGTSEWKDETVTFVTPANGKAVMICIQRQACAVSPCPIFGRAWFDNFIVEEW